MLVVAGWWLLAVWLLLVAAGILIAGWLLVEAGILPAGWLLVAAGILHTGWLLVAAGILLAGWLLVAAGYSLLVYCWLLLRYWLLVDCCWLLLGYCLLLDCCWLLLGYCLLVDCWLRLGYCLLIAGRLLQAKNSLNNSTSVMRMFGLGIFWNCVWIFSEQEFSSRFMMRGKWKRVLPRGIEPVDCSKRLSKMRVWGYLYPVMAPSSGCPIGESHRFSKGREVGVSDVNCSADRFQNVFLSTNHVISDVIMRHTTWPVTWSCKHCACLNLNIEPIALNHAPTRSKFLLFLPLCNSNPFSFLLYRLLLSAIRIFIPTKIAG